MLHLDVEKSHERAPLVVEKDCHHYMFSALHDLQVEHPLAEAIPEISDASDLNVHDDFSISLDPEFGECAHGLDEILSELQPEIDDY
mgnify:CR=1 FL=1